MNEKSNQSLPYYEKARELHQKHLVVDAHFDLLHLVLGKRLKGETRVIERDYLPSMKEGGIGLVISSLFVPNEYLPEMGLRRALDQVSALHAEMEESPGLFALCRNTQEIRNARQKGQLAILLSFEGLEPIGNDLALLRIFYELGVRGIGMTWSRRNYAADGCFFDPVEEGQKGGLTDFGVKVVQEAARLGMYLDISHLNDEGVEDLFHFYHGPVMASHSDCRALVPSMRNLTDDLIRRLASSDGVMGMNALSIFVGNPDEKKLDEKDLANHVDHICDLVGVDHVGFGFDFCDEMADFTKAGADREYDCIKGHDHSIELSAELLSRGYSEADVVKIIGGNFLRFLEKTIG